MGKTVYKGILKTWKDDRGFGFILPDNGDKDVFMHISALKGIARRPTRGDVVYYELAKDVGGKFKAVNASIEGVEIVAKPAKAIKLWVWLAALILGLASVAVAAYFM